ncbi:hypothetical protein B0H11DRAFT_2187507 [Mycena galericulata]|nr:hypothetical protein B0H11DRAFT_2187507 [Mycena galericulata]
MQEECRNETSSGHLWSHITQSCIRMSPSRSAVLNKTWPYKNELTPCLSSSQRPSHLVRADMKTSTPSPSSHASSIVRAALLTPTPTPPSRGPCPGAYDTSPSCDAAWNASTSPTRRAPVVYHFYGLADSTTSDSVSDETHKEFGGRAVEGMHSSVHRCGDMPKTECDLTSSRTCLGPFGTLSLPRTTTNDGTPTQSMPQKSSVLELLCG